MAKVEILHGDDGRYEYRAFAWIEANEERHDPAYWSPIEGSGLYESAEQAEHNASRLIAAHARKDGPAVPEMK